VTTAPHYARKWVSGPPTNLPAACANSDQPPAADANPVNMVALAIALGPAAWRWTRTTLRKSTNTYKALLTPYHTARAMPCRDMDGRSMIKTMSKASVSLGAGNHALGESCSWTSPPAVLDDLLPQQNVLHLIALPGSDRLPVLNNPRMRPAEQIRNWISAVLSYLQG